LLKELEAAEKRKRRSITRKKFELVIRNKKALSPIFATLIILAVVTVLFIPVFIWATGIASQNQESWLQSGLTATERIVIEEVSFNDTSTSILNIQNCTIYVRNIGETAVTINDVIISSPNGDVHTYQKLPMPYWTKIPIPLQLSTIVPLTSCPLNQNNMVSMIKGDLMELRLPRLNCTDPPLTSNPFRIASGTTYTIKVFTTRGVSDAYQVVASSGP
jgi:flagellin-like protein